MQHKQRKQIFPLQENQMKSINLNIHKRTQLSQFPRSAAADECIIRMDSPNGVYDCFGFETYMANNTTGCP